VRPRHSLRRSLVWVLIVSLLLPLFTASGVLAAPATAPMAQEEPAFRLELPRIVVTIDEEGYPSVFGLSVKDIQNMTGMDMSMARVPENTLQMMAQAQVQHIEVALNSQGLFLFVNGKPLPYLEWDQERLTTLVDALQAFQVPNAPLIARLVPFLQYIGLSVAVQFPLPEGAEPVPMRDTEEFFLVDTEAARGEVAVPSTILYAEVNVDAEGVPSIMDLSVRQIQEETGLDLSTAVVPPNIMAQMEAAGVQHMQLKTQPEGLYLYLNGKPLPLLAWDLAHLTTLGELVSGLMADQPWAPLISKAVPWLQAADIQLTVRFPLPPGAQELPLHDFSASE